MWTVANRKNYERKGLRYPSDMTEAEWALVKPLVDVPQRGQGRRRVVELREVLNAIFYILAALADSSTAFCLHLPQDLADAPQLGRADPIKTVEISYPRRLTTLSPQTSVST
jgi:Putative transposase of IS4/5 family (DUF4096)